MSLRFLSLQNIRLNVDTMCGRGHAEGTIDGVELATGDVVVITDHPARPAYGVKVALGDSAIIERVYLSFSRRIDR